MIAFRRLSTCPTLPDLLQRAAERRAVLHCRSMPTAAWCRPATIAVVWDHGLNGLPRVARPADGSLSRANSSGPIGEFAGSRAVSGNKASRQPMRTRSRAIARSRRAMMQAGPPTDAPHSWRYRAGVKLYFAGATGVLAMARVFNWCCLLSPDGQSAFLACADRLTRAGMRLWRTSRMPRRT